MILPRQDFGLKSILLAKCQKIPKRFNASVSVHEHFGHRFDAPIFHIMKTPKVPTSCIVSMTQDERERERYPTPSPCIFADALITRDKMRMKVSVV